MNYYLATFNNTLNNQIRRIIIEADDLSKAAANASRRINNWKHLNDETWDMYIIERMTTK